jgi:hypothetical protein
MMIKDSWQAMDNGYLYMAISYLQAELFLECHLYGYRNLTLKAIAIHRLLSKISAILMERAYNA